jgi:hypothetical protein
VDHAIRLARPTAQALKIFERTALDLGSRRGKGCGGRIRAGEAEHLMSRGDQLSADYGTDEAGDAGDEDTHDEILQVQVGVQAR